VREYLCYSAHVLVYSWAVQQQQAYYSCSW
jgi:hypothetical protein